MLGILYLSFQAFPFIFGTVHNFNTQSMGMSFLGIGVGMLLGISTQPYWNRYGISILFRYVLNALLNSNTGFIDAQLSRIWARCPLKFV